MTTADLQFLRAHPCVRFVSDRTRNYPQPTASVALTFGRESIPPSAYVHLVERSPQDPLARRGRGCWMRPGQLEIGAKLHQLLALPFAER